MFLVFVVRLVIIFNLEVLGEEASLEGVNVHLERVSFEQIVPHHIVEHVLHRHALRRYALNHGRIQEIVSRNVALSIWINR